MIENTVPLLKDDPAFWEQMAATWAMRLFARLAENNRCFVGKCGYRESDGWITPHPGQLVSWYNLIPKFLLHFHTTHGVSAETFVELISDDKTFNERIKHD